MNRIRHDCFAYVPAIVRAYFKTFSSKGFQNAHSDTKLTVTDATDAKKSANACLRDPNPMEDIPDQDSAPKTENKLNLMLLTQAILGVSGCVRLMASVLWTKFQPPKLEDKLVCRPTAGGRRRPAGRSAPAWARWAPWALWALWVPWGPYPICLPNYVDFCG